jgi:glycosyltransferase involved in cell wall biosynthesis
MEFAYFGFAYLLLAISIVNFFTMRTPAGTQTINEAITVLLPVRNEADNIEGCVQSLKTQIGVPNLRVVIIDDESSDRTKELAFSAISGDSRFTVIDSGGPRAGWLGKVSALQTGLEKTDGGYLVTLDADVKLEASALVNSINLMNEIKIDFLSPYPRQLAFTLSEKLVQPLLHWSWMTTVILRLAEKFPLASTAVANGQLFIVRVLLVITGSPLGWLIYASIVITRMLSDTRGKSDSFFALFHPISSLILIYLIFYSWLMRGKVKWKGRLV